MPGYDILIRSPHKGPSVSVSGEDAIRFLADYATETRWEGLPPDAIEHARRILLDTIGVALGGSIEPEVKALARRYGRTEGGPSTLIGHGLRSSPVHAVLVNGTAATWMDFDSGHRPPPGKPLLPAAHPPIHLVPAGLAVGEAMAVSGKALLTALVVGYDAGARIGLAGRVRPEIHCHGTHHNVAAAVAAARLAGAGREGMEKTIGLAAHLSLMPSFENAYQGGTVRNTYAAVGAVSGILAPQLAAAGFTPERDAFGTVFGSLVSPWFDPQRAIEGLGKRFEITRGFIKLYPMCRFGHPAIEAAQKLIEEHFVSADEIESVEVDTFDWAASLNERAPKTDLAAKFSVPWAVACMLVRRSAGPEEFRPYALEDVKLREMAARVTVREDSQYSAMTPDRRPARIRVQTKSGKVYQAEVERSSGGPDAPVSRDKVIDKFRVLADPVLGPEQAGAVVEMVMGLEKEPDIRKLTRLLMPMKAFPSHAAKSGVEMSGEKAVQGDHLDQLAGMAASISLERIPSSILHEGKRTLIDTVGVILAGMGEPPIKALARHMAEASVAPCSSILGSADRADAMWTAFSLGAAGLWHEFDAGNRFTGGHPALYAVSVGLPVAEREGASGKRLLESIIAGYEVGARIGLGATLRPGIDPHGSWPIVTGAVTASILTDADIRRTINLVTSLNLAASSRAGIEGATIRDIYAGFGSAMGVLAADLCRDGFSAERDGISTVFGTIAGVYFDVEKALEKIGERWEIERGYYKPYACARSIHSALHCLVGLAEEEEITPEDVERIEVGTCAMAAAMNDTAPGNGLAARFSIPHALASYLVLKETGIAAYSEAVVRDPKIRNLAARIGVRSEREMNGRTPIERPAGVRVKLRDGRVLERRVSLPPGEFDMRPMSDEEISGKFLRLASLRVGIEKASLLLDRLWHIEKATDVREILALCRPA
jgi:2-methylcitrate dehydratase PrpD